MSPAFGKRGEVIPASQPRRASRSEKFPPNRHPARNLPRRCLAPTRWDTSRRPCSWCGSCRSRSASPAAGVSALAALNAVVSAFAWTAYGLIAGLPVVWVVSILALIPGIWQAFLLRRELTRRDLVWASAYVAALSVAYAAGLLGAALAGTVLVTAGPQLYQALTETDLSGLAPNTWRIALLDAASWGLYGLALGDFALLGYFVVLTASAAIILIRIRQTRAAAAATPAGA